MRVDWKALPADWDICDLGPNGNSVTIRDL